MKLCTKQFIADDYLLRSNAVLQLTLCTVLYSFVFSSSTEVMMSYSSFRSVLVYPFIFMSSRISYTPTLFFLSTLQ
jgi:hypothetical protein